MNKNVIKNIKKRGVKCPPPRKKFSIKYCKDNTIKSLQEVECFLNDFNKFIKYIKLYKILK